MSETAKYMTVEECNLYRELAAKDDKSALFAMALPCTELPPNIKVSPKRKPRTKNSARRQGR